MTPYSCHDRMCGADDCRNCHPENFNPLETTEDLDIPHEGILSTRDLDRLADEYELRRNI